MAHYFIFKIQSKFISLRIKYLDNAFCKCFSTGIRKKI